MKRRSFLQAASGLAVASAASHAPLVTATNSGSTPSEKVSSIPVSNAWSDSGVEPWMEGFPPPPERIIRFNDGSYAQWPQLRWSFCHIEELAPTRTIWRGTGPTSPLIEAPRDISGQPINTLDGRTLSLAQALSESYTDGLLVLHRGKIVHEQYFGHCQPHSRHIINSATKSYTGTTAQELVHRGVLDRGQQVAHYLPELKDTAYGDARVADVMDMLIGMKFDEDYNRPESEVYRYLTSMGMLPHTPGSDLPVSTYQYLPNIPKQGEHNKVFAYREPNISVLGWMVRRASGKALTDLYSEMIWQPLGMDRDAYVMIDGWGSEGSICCTLRDFARFGEMIRNRGQVDGQQVFSKAVVDAFFRGGDVDKFAAGDTDPLQSHSYTSQWWVRHLDGRNAIQARGAYGQSLYIDPAAEVVIARLGSSKTASSKTLEYLVSPIHDAIVAAL